jgi:tol-pal system protein YbgF
MIKSQRFFLVLSFAILFPFNVLAEAPVVDDSENFALLEEQQAAMEQPVARYPSDVSNPNEEPALANDTLETSSNNDNARLLEKVQGLQQEIQELRGQIEVQAHDIKLLQQQQLAFYKDVDARLQRAPTTPARASNASVPTDLSIAPKAAPPTPTPVTVSAPDVSLNKPKTSTPAPIPAGRTNPADEQISYLAAYELIKNKKFDEALSSMETFVGRYPQGGYTANAQYWLGELYMVKKSYPQAIEHFEIVLHKFPSSSKAAASLLKIGYALAASGKVEEAKIRLQQVVKTYPDTNTAQLANTKLETLEV